MSFFKRWFGDNIASSAKEAIKRLRFALIYDRTDIAPYLLESLRLDMIAVLKKYMDIDETKIEMTLDHNVGGDEHSVALVTNVPVLRIKRLPAEGEAAESGGHRPVPRAEQRRDSYGKSKRRR